MRAIVLSGGGSKGSYEIGVWKALRKLKIDYDIVTGTSVGALNGSLMVEKSYFKALFLWRNLTYDKVFEIDENFDKDEIIKFYKENIFKGGVDVTNLENTIKKCLNPKKFFKSKIKYGLITVRFPSFKHVEITKKNLNENNLVDYLIASASCFPAFKVKKINNESYIDGGFYDNLPINLAIDLGATEIIAIDLKEVGIKRNAKKDIPTTIITPKNEIDSFLKFEKDSSKRGIRLGYNDTMKVYSRLDGNKYTFKFNNLRLNNEKYKNAYLDKFNTIIKHSGKLSQMILKNISFKKLFEETDDMINEVIEKLGYLMDIDDSYIYDIKKFNKMVLKRFSAINIDLKQIEDNIDKNRLKVYLNNKIMVKYLYDLISNNDYDRINKLCLLFPYEFLMSLYIKTIEGE